jgi:hypothetical protein
MTRFDNTIPRWCAVAIPIRFRELMPQWRIVARATFELVPDYSERIFVTGDNVLLAACSLSGWGYVYFERPLTRCLVHGVMEGIEPEPIRCLCPALADVFVGCEALQRLQALGVIVSGQEGRPRKTAEPPPPKAIAEQRFIGLTSDRPSLRPSPQRLCSWCAALILTTALAGCAKLDTPTARLQRIETTCASRPEADRRACMDLLTRLEIAKQLEDRSANVPSAARWQTACKLTAMLIGPASRTPRSSLRKSSSAEAPADSSRYGC